MAKILHSAAKNSRFLADIGSDSPENGRCGFIQWGKAVLMKILYPSHRRSPQPNSEADCKPTYSHHRYFHTPGTNLLKSQRLSSNFVKSHEIFVVNLKSPVGACGAARHAPPHGWGDEMMPGGIHPLGVGGMAMAK